MTVLVVVNLIRGRRIDALPANESTKRIAYSVSEESRDVPLLLEMFIVKMNAALFS